MSGNPPGSKYRSMPDAQRPSPRVPWLTLPRDLIAWIEEEAAARGIHKSALVREILEAERERKGR